MPSTAVLWSLRDIQQIRVAGGIKFVVTTDRPCRLWLRYTLTPPRRHAKPIYRRGVVFTVDIRFCFVVYKDNEQEEPYDSLIHTFFKLDWPVCETRYFYFHGEIAGVPSVSVSPIFEKHLTAVPWLLLFTEPWTHTKPPPTPPPDLELLFTEPWGVLEPWILLFTEEWTT
ncbi:hypothetical protein ES703_122048 [subsurface metagenome]